MTCLLEVEGLGVEIATANGPLRAVQNVGFKLNRAETLCIVGESGCGKSLTALALMNVLPKRARRSASRLTFSGLDLLQMHAHEMARLRGNRMSMIFQEPMTSLNPVFTIGDQLTSVFRQHGKGSRAEAAERAVYLLERVGIADPRQRMKQYPHELSGGMQQRAMIAMALMCGPDVILADEPTTALDVTIQAELLRLLSELRSELGMGMILITHDLGIVSRLADTVIVMYAGQIIEAGTVEQIFSRPQHPYTRALINCVPDRRRRRMEHLPSIGGVVPSLIGDVSGCRFQPRCPHAIESCRKEVPLVQLDEGHACRCVLLDNWSSKMASQSAAPCSQRPV